MAKVSKYGQWKYPGEDTIIPSGDITMKGVPYPVLGIDNLGNFQMMMPGANYQFPGNAVYEIPMMSAGGMVNPCPPGKVPDGKGNCVDDLTTPPIPTSNLYNYYNTALSKYGEDTAGRMVSQKRKCTKDGCIEIWEEEPEPVVETKIPKLDKGYYLIPSGNPGVAVLNYRENAGDGKYISKVLGPVHARDFLNDDQQAEFFGPKGGTTAVDYDPNTSNIIIYPDMHSAWKVIDDERGVKPRVEAMQQKQMNQVEAQKAAQEQWEKEQREKQKKKITQQSEGFAMGGEPDPERPWKEKYKSKDGNYLYKAVGSNGMQDYDNSSVRRTLKGFITGAPKPAKTSDTKYVPAKFGMGGGKMVKIKSLPKAQDLGQLKPEQRKHYEDRYVTYRSEGEPWDNAHKLALNDANYFNTGPILNFQPFLPNPDSGVRIASGKKYPLEHIDWSTYNPRQQFINDPAYMSRYNRATPGVKEHMDKFIDNMAAENYFKSLDDVKDWEKSWYFQRAKLPQFTDIATKRLNLIENVNMQPFGDEGEFSLYAPEASGVYLHDGNYVGIPSTSFASPSTFVHERSHWYDWNAPQNEDMYNWSFLKSKLLPINQLPDPVYNEEDALLYNIIPSEYKLPYGVVDPLRLGENDTNTYNSESERIIANTPKADNSVGSKSSIKLPFAGDFEDGNEFNRNYYYKPTEVRARLNEWRFQHNIDPTKNYTNEELQQIIDNDIKTGKSGNFDLYKVIRGRGDLLKQLHDVYVSNDTTNEDEFPKAQTGGLTEEQLLTNRNRVFQDVILDDEMFDEGDFELYLDQAQTGGDLPADYQDFLNYSETAPENRRPNAEWQYGNPRQYDHYGMWDALGKPKTFEEALANYPQWQPDPGDGYYHGFSTNPNTGVWLKSHIPGESHPGDTGWMEYKDFMLSNDRNWGAKNQNLVFDPEIQRMRYVERKQGGGSPILNMMQQYGYKPGPETPNVFDQMRTMGILPQPTPTLVEQYNQVMNAFDKPKPKPVRFKVPEDYYTRLMQQENGLNKGLKDGRYYQYTSEEGGNDTIGYGHKLTDDDIKTGRYSKGLTKDEAIGLMRNDVEEHLDRTLEQYEAKYGKGSFDKLHPDLKVLALDFVYNGLPITEYPNFFGAANQYSTTKDANAKKQAYEKMLKNYIRNVKKDGVLIPLGERNKYTRSVLDNLK